MSAACGHSHDFDGADPAFRRILVIVAVINFLMFGIEIVAGGIAGSQALKADALDFFADGVTYTISLVVIGMSLETRAKAAMAKGISLLLMGLWVAGTTIYNLFILQVPQAHLMGGIGAMALVANVISVLLLMKWRNGDANVRSVWLCSRNDAISNIAVMIAALGVFGTGTAWPDLIVAAIMSGLFLSSSVQILKQASRELRSGEAVKGDACCAPKDDHDCAGGHHHDHS